MKLINIIPIQLFLQCTHATFLPEDGILNIHKDVHVFSPEAPINWTRCKLGIDEYKKDEKAFECGNLTVPLDYTDEYNTSTTTLNLIRLRATEKCPKGSIIVNFGGPGYSGIESLLKSGRDLSEIVGGHYDMISFDPRGTGRTMVPLGDKGIIKEILNTVQNSPYSIPPPELVCDISEYIDSFMEFFVTNDADHAEFRGTAFVARDVVEIAMALDEGYNIKYWGISYGTVLGQVLAGMFPDRIERMLLDGNLLADDYDECMAAKNDSCLSAGKLSGEQHDFLEVLNHVFMVCTGVGGGLRSPKSLLLTQSILSALYDVEGYRWLDELINTALEGNRSKCSQKLGDQEFPWNPQSDLAHLAIWCSDSNFRIETIEELFSFEENYQANSNPFFYLELLRRSVCLRWSTHTAEPINLTSLSRVKTKNPILLVNGLYDPVTPLGNAREISARFPGSQVVVDEGVGHGSTTHPSSCIQEIVARFFIRGEMPLAGVTCKPDNNTFEIIEDVREKERKRAGKRKVSILLSGGVNMSAEILAGGKANPSMGVETRNDNNGDLVTATEEQSLQRGLHERHLSMLGIAGAIGTGLFLGLGQSVQTGGPLGALLGYATVGLVVCAVQFALGEVAALLPVTGAFVRHAEFLVDPAWGFAIGWNLVYGNVLSIPSEITAICVLFEFWTDINPSLWIMIFIVLTTVVGLCFVRVFGEVEFWFALLKILLVVFLIILGLVINLGGVPGTERIGFRYWKDPGPFVEYIASGSWGHFLGYWSVMTSAVFSFAGVESIAMAAAETRNPARAIPRACKNVFIRILVFYILAILIVGMLVRSDDERLNDQSGAAGQSPFVIAASAAGIPAIPSVVNAVVITSAWSASNQSLLAGTRVLYGLALKRQAPQIFLRTTAWGVPYVCVLFFTCFMFLSFMSLSNGAMTVFWWLVDLTAAGVLISWASILLNHIRLRLAMKKQGIPIENLPWHNSWTFYSSCAGLFMTLLILLTGGFRVFTRGNWDPVGFVSSYLDIPLVIAAYLIWKFVKKTKIVPLAEVPLQDAFRKSEEDHEVVTA
ncbi:hypothetical protein FGADI_808 [Fusarium gaditjirri]|uniref:Amino acid permease/ SLC12A domain-containing protein n=1 Tax=Fusarium gaditjirri TaxID=282569 RepID=A0A8H4TMV7_9HYPO|nr:hypothetical protein FGADI_808 [Fusarium gaditjirri]